MTGDDSKDLTLFDKLKLYPEIVLAEALSKVRNDLRSLLDKINAPGEDDDPGLVLEELAKLFLGSPYLILNCTRRRCEAGEIDLDFTVKKFETTLFYEFSYLLIVECKNWSKKAGAPELRVFCSKVRDVGANVGIIFSKKGITRDAKRIIRDACLQDQIVVLVFDINDLDQVINSSKCLYETLNKKYLAVITASKE